MSDHVDPSTYSPISEGFMATQDQWNEVENRLVQPWTASELLTPEEARELVDRAIEESLFKAKLVPAKNYHERDRHVDPPTCSPISEGFMATQDQWNEVENRLVQPWTAPEELPYVLRPERACILDLLHRVKALEGLNCTSAILKLSGRVDALEANMNGIGWAFDQFAANWEQDAESENLRQQDEDVERVAGDLQPVATDEELAACSADAAKVAILEHRDYDKALTSADIAKVQSRALYDLGCKHGATQATCAHIRSSDEGTSYCALAEQSANSKPTPNFDQMSSADTGLLPMIVSETGSDDEPEIERIICSAISGGADYVNGMPRELSLQRIRYGDLHIGSLRTSARYVQAPLEVVGPTPSPVGELKEMLTKVFNEGLRLRRYAATDVIEAVADWLEHQRDIPIGVSVEYIAAMLRSEANR